MFPMRGTGWCKSGPTTAAAPACSNDILFTGHRLDGESGLYYALHRHYHPTLGRWISRDPKGYVDGMGLYEYVGGHPGVGIDPLGSSDWNWGGWVDYTGLGTVAHGIYDVAFETAYAALRTYDFLSKEMGDTASRREAGHCSIARGQVEPNHQDPVAKDWKRVQEAASTLIKNVPGTSITGPLPDPTRAADVAASAVLSVGGAIAEGYAESGKEKRGDKKEEKKDEHKTTQREQKNEQDTGKVQPAASKKQAESKTNPKDPYWECTKGAVTVEEKPPDRKEPN